jgi:glycosyltransferase involved in cell wall biosynthesis
VPKKLVVLNDLHPSELAGAATIAYELAIRASQIIPTEYWYASSDSENRPSDKPLKTRVLRIDVNKLAAKQSKFVSKIWRETFNFKALVWLCINLKKSSPDIVWVHQIGNRFPRSILLACWFLGIPTFTTAHDFGLIVPRKLFPEDLGFGRDFPQDCLRATTVFSRTFPTEKFKFRILLFLRVKLQVFIYNNFTNLICISSMQAEIFSRFGFRVNSIIENGIDECTCEFVGVREANSILFAGRSYGKGLTYLLQSIKQSDWHLFLAGGAELATLASEVLHEDQFTYLGLLDRNAVYETIHRVSCVSVISECFDVFPTILIEAATHGTISIATETVGNSKLLKEIDTDLIIPHRSVPDLIKIEATLRDIYAEYSNKSLATKLNTVNETLNLYLKKFEAG